MRIESLTLHRVVMALREPLVSAHGVESVRDVLLVELHSDVGVGWGECAALAEPTYSSESTERAVEVVAQRLGPTLMASDVSVPADVASVLDAANHPMAVASVEMAVLDAFLRAEGVSLAQRAGATAARIPSGVVLGVSNTASGSDALLSKVEARLREGYQRIKLKIEPGRDVGVLRALRDHFPAAVLAADANGSYTASEPPPDTLDDLGLAFVEQPFAAGDLDASAGLAARWHTPICLDESIRDHGSLQAAIETGAGSIVNLKPGRVGGHLAAVDLHRAASEAGVPTFVGGMLETAIGRAAAVVLAARPKMDMAHDLAASNRYFDVDLAEPFVLSDGCLEVPSGPGLGRAPDPAVLEAHTVDRRTIVRA